MKKILFPLIPAGTGSDIFTSNLVYGLNQQLMHADIQLLPPISDRFPFIAGRKCNYSGYDLIHTNTWNGYVFKNNLPLVTTEHHVVHNTGCTRNANTLNRIYFRLIYHREKKSLNCADMVTCVSRYTQKKVETVFGYSDSRVVYNGIDTDVFRPLPFLRKRFGIPDNKIILLFVGNLCYRKGADLLIPIMKNLGDDYVLLTTGGLRNQGDIVQDNVMYLGRLSRDHLIEAYNICDIFLFPSRLEGFGLSVAEAMSCGKPVVTSDCSSLPELIINEKGGLLCRSGDIRAFTHAVKMLSDDPFLRQKQGEFNRTRAMEYFSIERMAQEYVRLYKSI